MPPASFWTRATSSSCGGGLHSDHPCHGHRESSSGRACVFRCHSRSRTCASWVPALPAEHLERQERVDHRLKSRLSYSRTPKQDQVSYFRSASTGEGTTRDHRELSSRQGSCESLQTMLERSFDLREDLSDIVDGAIYTPDPWRPALHATLRRAACAVCRCCSWCRATHCL